MTASKISTETDIIEVQMTEMKTSTAITKTSKFSINDILHCGEVDPYKSGEAISDCQSKDKVQVRKKSYFYLRGKILCLFNIMSNCVTIKYGII